MHTTEKKWVRTLQMMWLLARSYPLHATLTVILLMLAGLMEGIGIAMLLPLLETALGDGGEAPNLISRAVGAALRAFGFSVNLESILSLLVCVILAKAAINLLAQVQVGFTLARVTAGFQLRLLRGIMRVKWPYFVGLPAGRATNAVSVESQYAATCYHSASMMLSSSAQVLAQLCVAFLVSPLVTLGAIGIGVAMVLLLRTSIYRTRLVGEKRRLSAENLTARLVEAIGGVKALKAMGLDRRFGELLQDEVQDLEQTARRHVVLFERVRAVPEPVTILTIAGAIYLFRDIWVGQTQSLLVLAVLFHRVVQGCNLAQRKYQTLIGNEPGFWFVHDLANDIEGECEILETGSTPKLEQAVSLDEVTFSYHNKPVLKSVSMKIPVGGMVTVIGASGAGKTTLADLIAGLQFPQGGTVLIDGTPLIHTNLRAWRAMVGYVSQESFLFHASILSNVSFDDTSMSEKDVTNALKIAGAWDFVSALPDAVHTVVGEHGGRLSGGQRQRISIARAIIRKPKLLILDEPTSALDQEVESIVLQNIKSLNHGMAILCISHDGALVEAADMVYQLRDGQLTAIENKLEANPTFVDIS